MPPGLLSFVSLGPGDPALRTERAAARLAAADLVASDADAIPVAELVAQVRTGKRVVRAVAGDALESVDALEEVLAAARAGVPFEIVPGVGARAAATAFAGVVGRAAVARAGEAVAVVEREPREAVVTLVVGAGTASQRVLVTTAGEVAARARELGDAEVIVAIGAPDDALRWFERRPLFGKRVLVTRARDQAGGTATLLRDEGAEPLVVPTIELRAPADGAPLARAIASLSAGEYAWAAFTSANGVERAWDAVVAAGGDARAFAATRLAAIGPATARALFRHGLRADVVADEFVGEALACAMLAAMKDGPSAPRVMLARAARARDALPDALRAAGCAVDVVAAYETHPPPAATVEALVRDLEARRVDAVTFTSSSTVDNLCDVLGARVAELLSAPRVASIGPITTAAALARGVRVDVTAAEYTVPGLVRALADSYR